MKDKIDQYICSNKGTYMKNNPTIVPVAHIIELGTATTLTLGSGTKLFEGPDGRPARS